jgi:hypothetical protein
MDYNGKCTLWDADEDEIIFEHIIYACDEEGYCLVDDDEDPALLCEDYEE